MALRGDEAISPTAHYTAEVWARNGLSHPAFRTLTGRAMHDGLAPWQALSRWVGGPTLDAFLIARHRIIDRRLDDAIADGRVGQVVEIAAGLSARGWRFTRAHPQLTYVEADLPAMAARKGRALERAWADDGGVPARHRVAAVDAFAADGPASLGELAASLGPAKGVAVITEGLLNYVDRDRVLGLWRHLTEAFRPFPALLYLSDLHVRSTAGGPLPWLFSRALEIVVRGRIHLHFADPAEAVAGLRACGFDHATLLEPTDAGAHGPREPGSELTRVVEAWM